MATYSRKRKLSCDQADTNAIYKFERYRIKISDVGEACEKAMRRLKRLLVNSKENMSFVEHVKKIADISLLACFLSKYSATMSTFDRTILSVLCLLERAYGVNLSPMYPLVWGPKSAENYERLQQLGSTLHSRFTSDQVLDCLDPKLVWHSLLKMNSDSDERSALYDAHFLLRLFVSLLDEGTDVRLRKFVISNALSYAFAATSSNDKKERAVAYHVLRRFLIRSTDLSTEFFIERRLYVYILKLFSNSVPKSNAKIPHVVSHFFARVSKLLLHPNDPIYASIMAFLTIKPTIELDSVPEFFKLFLSSSTLYHKEERQWLLKLIAESMIEPNDYNILQKRAGVTICLSYFATDISDCVAKKYLLLMLRSALRFPSVAADLFNRHNFHSWIAATVQQPFTNRWEVLFLCQLFVTLVEQMKSYYSNPQRSKDKSVIFKQRTCQMLAVQILSVIDKENDGSKKMWESKLNSIINDDWFASSGEMKC